MRTPPEPDTQMNSKKYSEFRMHMFIQHFLDCSVLNGGLDLHDLNEMHFLNVVPALNSTTIKSGLTHFMIVCRCNARASY
jgi:hypothetical protein